VGNVIRVTNAKGEHVATGDHGMACCALVSHIADTLGLPLMPIAKPELFNEWAEVFEKVASPEQWIVFRFFLSDDETFTVDDIPVLERAVEAACSDKFKTENPQMVLGKYLELLKEHGSLTLEYQHAYSAMTITEGK